MSDRKGADLGLVFPSSTIGFGLPTAVGRTDGDLHYDRLAQREYTLVAGAWVNTSGAINSVGAGLPPMVGRVAGDHHFNTTNGRDYVLTGVAGGSDGDDFNRADTAAGSGSIGASSGGRTWVADHALQGVGNYPRIVGNKIKMPTASFRGGWLINVGSAATGGTVQASVHQGATASQDFSSFTLYIGSPTTADGESNQGVSGQGWQLRVELGNGSSNGLMHINPPDGGFPSVAMISPINTTSTYTLVVSADGKSATAYRDNIAILSYTSATAPSGTYAGFQILGGVNAATGAAYLDDFSISLAGSLAWTPTITAAGLGITGTSLMNYKGAWNSGTAYAANDVVSRAYGLYVALLGSTNNDPATTPVAASVGGNLAAASTDFNGMEQSFTVNATTVITHVSVVATGSPFAGGETVGISSTVNTVPTYMGSATLAASAIGVTQVVALNTPVTLVPGTTYGFVNTSGRAGCVSGAGTPSGIVATLGNMYYSTNFSSSTGSFKGCFGLLSAAVPWQKIARGGNQENVGQVGASGAAVTLADPEIQPITRVVLTANCTITVPTVASGKSFKLVLVQDATGSRTVAFTGATVLWPGGTAPTLTTTANKGDVLEFMADGGGNWLGRVVAQNY